MQTTLGKDSMQTITLRKPDDWHCHLRDGDFLARTVGDISQRFARAIVMPNLEQPIINASQAQAYRQRILSHVPAGNNFTPLMTLYLTQSTTPETIAQAKQKQIIAAKLYPRGATTLSQSGIQQIQSLYPIFAAMQQHGMVLCIHGESPAAEIDIFDREAYFIEHHLKDIVEKFPELRIVLEHISTKTAVDFIHAAPKNLAATITAHHLLLNRNDLLAGGIRPHYYCLPIVKTHHDQQALITAATSGNAKFFLGTDSAPHSIDSKQSACGCAGIYTAHAAIELYAQVFDTQNALDKLEAFASIYGADFYGLARNQETITLIQKDWQVPETLSFGNTQLRPFASKQTLTWQLTQ